MVSSVDPALQAALSQLQATKPAGHNDPAGAKMFADLMQGTGKGREAPQSSALALLAPGDAQSGSSAELLQQLSGLQDPADPIKAQFVMMDVLGQRMEFLGRVHYTVALGSGFTGIFKQLFNRHD